MPKIQVKVFNPLGRNGFTALKSARRDVKRGRAHWLEVDMVIEYSAHSQISPPCIPSPFRPAKPAQSVNLEVAAIDAATCDSNMAQTFLAYPQRSLESYGPAYPALALDNAGLG